MTPRRMRSLWRDGETCGMMVMMFFIVLWDLLTTWWPDLAWQWDKPLWVRIAGLLLIVVVVVVMHRHRDIEIGKMTAKAKTGSTG